MEPTTNGLETTNEEPIRVPEKHFDVSELFRSQAEQEKKAYLDWMSRLTPEETQTYEQMGYHFQLLRAICQNLEMIALSKDDNNGERFSFNEVIDLVKDLEKMAEKFLGREAERKSNPALKQLVSAYNILRIFAAKQENQTYTEDQDGYSLSIMPHFDNDFMELVEKVFPNDMVRIIEEMEKDTDDKKANGREEAAKSFEKMVVGLQHNEKEKMEFIEALKAVVKVRQKVIQGKKRHGPAVNQLDLTNQIDLQDIHDVINALSRMECLRRIYHSGAESAIRGNEQTFGLHEINRLVRFIRNWKRTFRWLGKMKVGMLIPEDREETDEEREKKEEEREKREQEELEKKYDIIKNFTESFNTIFPDPVAPMIVRRHREILRQRIRNYPQLIKIISELPEALQTDFKRVLFQISTTLSYLDYMWNMHQVEENSAGKHIVYPKKMLLLGPFILQEIENLGAIINLIINKHDKRKKEDMNMDDGFFEMETQPKGLAMPYEDSVEFKIGPHGIINVTHDKAVAAADIQTKEELEALEQNKIFMESLETICLMLMVETKKARRNLKAAKVKNVITNDEASEDEKSSPTLSYDIHDFISDIQDMFSVTLYQIAVLFDKNVIKQQLLPELAAHEEQAARLRSQIHSLGARIRPGMQGMVHTLGPEPGQPSEVFPDGLKTAEIVPVLTDIIGKLAKDIGGFQHYQEMNLNAKKYHEVLRGAGYEKLVRVANALSDFTANHQEKFDIDVVDLYVFRKKIDEFAEKLQLDMKNGIVAVWLKDLEILKKVENRILANGLKSSEMEKLQREYTENFMYVLNVMFDICNKDEVVHTVADKKDPELFRDATYKVPADVKARFVKFSEANPLVSNCQTDYFTPSFYKFYKLAHLMSDFMQVWDIQMSPNTPEQEFLKEYDMKKAEILKKECEKLLQADYSGTNRVQENSLMLSLATCREALGHLMFRAPEQAEHLDAIFNDMENTVRVLYEQGKMIRPEDLETFYLQFIREAVENPITVNY